MARISSCVLAGFIALTPVWAFQADQKKVSNDERIELLRGLSSEYATVKAPLPRSRKPLEFRSDGTYNQDDWREIGKQMGPAARIGDLIQITHVTVEKDSILLEINNGFRHTGSWRDHVQGGIGGVYPQQPVYQGDANAPGGTYIIVRFPGGVGDTSSDDVKKILSPVLGFEKHSATENYADTLPPAMKQAIEQKKALEGMDRDQVLLALGRPLHKDRETKNGVDYEDWIYGQPPGRVTFVTFAGAKVVKIKETYAGLGGTIADTPKQPE